MGGWAEPLNASNSPAGDVFAGLALAARHCPGGLMESQLGPRRRSSLQGSRKSVFFEFFWLIVRSEEPARRPQQNGAAAWPFSDARQNLMHARSRAMGYCLGSV